MTVTSLAWDTGAVPRRTTRTPGPDEWAAQRVRDEREQQHLSQGELARRVTEAGVPMQQQAIWKIENGDPPRKISYAEAVALCKVLNIELDELGEPPELYAGRKLDDAFRKVSEWEKAWLNLEAEFKFIGDKVDADPETFGPILEGFAEAVKRAEHQLRDIRLWLDRVLP